MSDSEMKNTKKSLQILNESAVDGAADGMSRRDFLKVVGAGATLTAVGCADSAHQNIVPYVNGEAEQVPGVAVHYNSTCSECSAGCGIRVRTREGRAVMVEGNKSNPINRGGLCALGHSALQSMYDPDRVRQPLTKKEVSGKDQFVPISWKEGVTEVAKALKGKGKKALITNATSGAEAKLVASWCAEHGVSHITYDPLQPVSLLEASKLTFGVDGIPEYKIDEADVVLNFGADFMETWLSPCGLSRDWAKSRKSSHPVRVMHVESRRSLTAANADHWFKSNPGSESQLALLLIKLLLERGKGSNLSANVKGGLQALVSKIDFESVVKSTGVSRENILLAAQFLQDAKSSLVLGGGAAHNGSDAIPLLSAVNLLNLLLGNVGKTVLLNSLRKASSSAKDLSDLVNELREGKNTYDLVMIYDSNPAFTAPASLGFEYAVKAAGKVVSFSSHMDESAKLAHMILPSSTGLESWGSAEPLTGVHTLSQPVMTQVFDTNSFGDTLISVSKRIDKDSAISSHADFQAYVKEGWKAVYEGASDSSAATFEQFWRASVERGGYFSDYGKAERVKVSVDSDVFSLDYSAKSAKKSKGLILYPYASVKTFDGRAANRPWMQELPDPMTKVVWDTWAEMHPSTATKLKLKQGDSVALTNNSGQLNVPVHITDDVHEGIVAVPIGNGHSSYGRYAEQVSGGNVYDLLSISDKSAGLSLASSTVVASRGRKAVKLVRTQEFTDQMDRHLAQTEEISTDHHGSGHHGAHHHEPEQAYEQRISPLYHWVMAVDLAACTGCSACVVACHAENNIPAVGKEVNYQGREMSWLRIERYNDKPGHGDHNEDGFEELQVSFLPMMCQHCQNAPCEPVCPVYATYHNEEGLNAMVYNRCVGTRYCGNNCSYKVRRFNWFEYEWPAPMDMQLNPDVTKRTAGIMEKCTFCIQRINEGKNRAKNEGRPVRDGDISPACVASCPTEALTFGNFKDKTSQVYKLSKSSRAYKVLDHHLNTQPSVVYLKNRRYTT